MSQGCARVRPDRPSRHHGSLILGKLNKAGNATEVRRTTSGPAMKFTTRPGSAPFSVTSGAKVPRLNADRVDGLEGSSLQTRTKVYRNTTFAGGLSDLRWSLPLSAGTYSVQYGVGLTPASATRIVCDILNTGDALPNTKVAWAVQNTAATGAHYLSGADVLVVKPASETYLECVAPAALSTVEGMAPHVNVTRIDATSTATMPQANS